MNNQQSKSKVFISHAIFNRIWLLVIGLIFIISAISHSFIWEQSVVHNLLFHPLIILVGLGLFALYCQSRECSKL